MMMILWTVSDILSKYFLITSIYNDICTINEPFNSVVQKAWNMFASRAYVHHNTKYGLSDDDFVDNFGYLEQILSDCQHL